MILLVPLARAADYTVAAGDDLCETVATALDYGGAVTVHVSGAHDTDCTSLQLDGATIALVGADRATTTLPPIEAQRSTVAVSDATLPGGATPSLFDVAGELGSDGVVVSLVAASSDVTLVSVDVTGTAGAGLVAYEGTLVLSDTTVADFTDWAGLYVFAGTDDHTSLTVDTDSHFTDDASGAVVLSAEAGLGAITATLTDVTFERNSGVGGADIRAIAVDSLALDGVRFTESFAYNGDVGDGTPVYTQQTALSLTDCTFSGTGGEQASFVVASGGTLSASGGSWSGDATMNGYAVMADGEGVLLSDLTVEGAGADAIGIFWLNAPDVRIEGSRFYGDGRRRAAPLLWMPYGAAMAVTDSTFCDVDGNADAEIVDAVGDLDFERNVLRQLDLGAEAVSNTGAVVARDNTFVDGNADFVGGAPSSLEFVNNLVAGGRIAVTAIARSETFHHNLYWNTTWTLQNGETDYVEADPAWASTYDAADCGAPPALSPDSPANAAGDPSEADTWGNVPSDIGAVDFDDTPDAVDTGDSGPGDDTGPGETGVPVDTADSAPPDTGRPDTGTPDAPAADTSSPRLTALRGGRACGCGGDARAILLLPLLSLRRRRPC